jgi:V8-like Glu-specific endopeptidase
MAHPPQEPVAQRTADDPRPVQTADGAKVLASFMLRTNGGGSLEEVAGFRNRRAIVDRFETVRLPVPPGYGYDTPAPWAGPALQPAWLGSVPFATGSILPVELRPPMPGAGLENVIGPDDRVMVPDTATIPWRCICHLEVIFDNGVRAYGTGWLVGPDTVITAAHCVWDPRTGEQAAEIRVAPGRNGSMGPYGQFVTADYAVMQGWPDAGNFGLDVAAIRLPRDAGMFAEGVGARLGYFGLAAFENAKLEMLLVNTAGYPLEAAKPFATQWFNGGRIKAAETDYVTYMIDTEGGQSGSPIFFYEKETEERLVVAIHTVGYYPNRGVRITPKLLEVIQGWIAKPPTGRPAKAARGRRRS